ncbi:MAG: PEP-CTERM sorting domain-containing protein [Tepidisphaeraceae bacterium]
MVYRIEQSGRLRLAILLGLWGIGASSVRAETHPSVPALSSRPGAAYTIYLDFAGFTFTGNWWTGTPGTTPAYNLDSDATTFSSLELSNITKVWARVAEKYAAFNINVTTVDPAVAAGKASTDKARQAYYDQTARLMHTVVGGTGSWIGGGGYSAVGTTKNTYATTANSGAGIGNHTNWVFSGQNGSNLQFIGEAVAHENGHGLGLSHQADYIGSLILNDYSTNNGSKAYAPTMGLAYGTNGNQVQRGTWRIGTNSAGATQNDVATILGNSGLTFVDDGQAHTLAAAKALPTFDDGTVNYTLAKGVIMPSSTASPAAIGASNYTSDFFSFQTAGGLVTLTANDGGELITAGVADDGATLNSTLSIFDSTGTLVGTGVQAASTLSETFSAELSAGTYYAQISSAGGYTSAFATTAYYYDMGSYFLTGSGFTAVPEPAALALLATAGVMVSLRTRRHSPEHRGYIRSWEGEMQ